MWRRMVLLLLPSRIVQERRNNAGPIVHHRSPAHTRTPRGIVIVQGDVRQSARRASNTIGVEVPVEVVVEGPAAAAPPEQDEDAHGDDRETSDTTNNASNDRTRMRLAAAAVVAVMAAGR